ncbi:unnamed protein product [Amoebophrya sp. A120]|nr:unnamed protein product [Amoebophrya sp. A120]|eukprot:GSA120T00014466001.1
MMPTSAPSPRSGQVLSILQEEHRQTEKLLLSEDYFMQGAETWGQEDIALDQEELRNDGDGTSSDNFYDNEFGSGSEKNDLSSNDSDLELSDFKNFFPAADEENKSADKSAAKNTTAGGPAAAAVPRAQLSSSSSSSRMVDRKEQTIDNQPGASKNALQNKERKQQARLLLQKQFEDREKQRRMKKRIQFDIGRIGLKNHKGAQLHNGGAAFRKNTASCSIHHKAIHHLRRVCPHVSTRVPKRLLQHLVDEQGNKKVSTTASVGGGTSAIVLAEEENNNNSDLTLKASANENLVPYFPPRKTTTTGGRGTSSGATDLVLREVQVGEDIKEAGVHHLPANSQETSATSSTASKKTTGWTLVEKKDLPIRHFYGHKWIKAATEEEEVANLHSYACLFDRFLHKQGGLGVGAMNVRDELERDQLRVEEAIRKKLEQTDKLQMNKKQLLNCITNDGRRSTSPLEQTGEVDHAEDMAMVLVDDQELHQVSDQLACNGNYLDDEKELQAQLLGERLEEDSSLTLFAGLMQQEGPVPSSTSSSSGSDHNRAAGHSSHYFQQPRGAREKIPDHVLFAGSDEEDVDVFSSDGDRSSGSAVEQMGRDDGDNSFGLKKFFVNQNYSGEILNKNNKVAHFREGPGRFYFGEQQHFDVGEQEADSTRDVEMVQQEPTGINGNSTGVIDLTEEVGDASEKKKLAYCNKNDDSDAHASFFRLPGVVCDENQNFGSFPTTAAAQQEEQLKYKNPGSGAAAAANSRCTRTTSISTKFRLPEISVGCTSTKFRLPEISVGANVEMLNQTRVEQGEQESAIVVSDSEDDDCSARPRTAKRGRIPERETEMVDLTSE